MVDEAEKEDEEDDQGVVHEEVGEVGFEAREGVVEGAREGEAVDVEHLAPWAARAETGFETFLGACDVLEVDWLGG